MYTDISRYKKILLPEIQRDLSDFCGTTVREQQPLPLSMSEIGRLNNENSKLTIGRIVRGLRAALERDKIPAIVAVAASRRSAHDLAIWPRPGALIRKTPVNCLHWTNTPKRSNAIFWSRELNGFRCYPKQRPDKALGLAKFADNIGGSSWLAIATRATSVDDEMLCRWVPQLDMMSWYTRSAAIPANALFQYPVAPYDAKNGRFDISADLLAQILGVKGVAS